MPKASNNNRKRAKTNNGIEAQRSSAVPHQEQDRKQTAVQEFVIEAAQAVYPGIDGTEQVFKTLRRTGFTSSAISRFPVSSTAAADSVAAAASGRYDDGRRDGLGGTIARIAGIALGIGSFALAVPMLVTAGLEKQFPILAEPVVIQVNTHDPALASKAATVLLKSGGQQVRYLGKYHDPDRDLKSRQYRDEEGRIHHHTHTNLRDQVDEPHSVAA